MSRYYIDDRDIPGIAKRYKTRTEFSKRASGAYKRATNLGILDEVCSHMVALWEKKWNKDSIAKEALKFGNRTDFMRNSGGCYNASLRLGITDEVCSHMEVKIVRWTDDMLKEIASKYNTRSEFKSKDYAAYSAVQTRGLLSELCSHMVSAKAGFNDDKPAILYYLSVANGAAYKIGITNRTVEDRYRKREAHLIDVLFVKEYAKGIDARTEERRILEEFKYAKYKGDALLSDGNTEMFDRDVLCLHAA